MTPPRQQQWPRGPVNELHKAADDGSTERTTALRSTGLINIDQGTPAGYTPLMYSARSGCSRVARILLSRKANVSIALDDGITALHLAALNGHLAVTVDLAKAGAELDARDPEGATPLHLAAQFGHSEVMAALTEAGANVNSQSGIGRTPLLMAALNGRLDAVKCLLRAKANPLLAVTIPSGETFAPLDVAAGNGHSKVVRELIQQNGIEGCGGDSGGVVALNQAARDGHADIIDMLMGAGVVDTGVALSTAAGYCREASVKFLLQQRRRRGPTDDYVNSCNPRGMTALFRSINVFSDEEGVPLLISPKVVRLLIDAGADTASIIRVTSTPGGEVILNGTPLAYTNDCLRKKNAGMKDASEEQMYRLEAVRRLLMRVEAVHAGSWLWRRKPLLVDNAADVSSKTTKKTAGSGTHLRLMLSILRRRGRGVLSPPLFRYSSYP